MRNDSKLFNKINGFTLIEILIVVLIVGLVYSIILPFSHRVYERFEALRRIEEIKVLILEKKRQSFLYSERIEIYDENNILKIGNQLFPYEDMKFQVDKPIIFFPLGTTNGGRIEILYRATPYVIEIVSPFGEIRLIK